MYTHILIDILIIYKYLHQPRMYLLYNIYHYDLAISCADLYLHTCTDVFMYILTYTYVIFTKLEVDMGWPQVVGSLKL